MISEKTNILIGDGQLTLREVWVYCLMMLKSGAKTSFISCMEQMRGRISTDIRSAVLDIVHERMKRPSIDNSSPKWRIELCEEVLDGHIA